MFIRNGKQTPPHHKVLVDSRSWQKAGQALPEGDAAAPFHEPHAALVQSHRVLVVLLHELLDREQMRLIVIAEVLREPDLLIEREDLLSGSRVDMEERTHTPQEFPCLRQRQRIRTRQDPSVRKLPDGRRLKPSHARPLQQMEIPQTALAFLDVRLEQIHRLPEFLILPAPLFELLIEVQIAVLGHDLPPILAMKLLKEVRASSMVVFTVASVSASSMLSAMVRTLCPT